MKLIGQLALIGLGASKPRRGAPRLGSFFTLIPPSDDKPEQSKPKRGRSLSERFHARVDKSGGDEACWIWQGAPDVGSGYGRIQNGTRLDMAHRVSWRLSVGEIPRGKNVLHGPGCSKLCVNPAHLRCGTQVENMADAKAEKRLGRRLTPSEACAIVTAVRDGLSYVDVATLFSISPQTVFNVSSGRTHAKHTGIKRKSRLPRNSRGKVELRAAA